jgi:hypothetical protein
VGGAVTGNVEYWAVCRDAMGLSTSRQLLLDVGQLLVCPNVGTVLPGNDVSFSAWYVEGGGASCSSDFSAIGATDVTHSSAPDPITNWSATNGTGQVSISNGVVRGVSSGSATVTATYKPLNASIDFLATASVFVGSPILCYECNQTTSECSEDPQYDLVNTPPQCSVGTFASRASCRFSCFKDRWEEVAP